MVSCLIPYHHTQRSSVIPWILALAAGFGALAALIWIALVKLAIITEVPPATAKWILLLVIIAWTIGMSILSWYFSSMTVDVTDDELRWRFAGGQGNRIARSEISNVRIVPHRWWAGYGIKYFGPKRWTYVIGGYETVEVALKSGGWRRLGTDDPHGLYAKLISSTR
jgi:hypothetical protein